MSKCKFALAACAWLMLSAAPLRADDSYDKLMQDFRAAQQNPAPDYAPRFRAYAERMATKPEAVPALVWLACAQLSNYDGNPSPDQRWALEQLAAHHFADPSLVDALREFRGGGTVALFPVDRTFGRALLVEFYEKLMARSPGENVKAAATFNLASMLDDESEFEQIPRTAAQKAADKQRAGVLFRRIVTEYPKTPSAGEAQSYVFQLDHLQVGMSVPELTGTDAVDHPLTLAQFRGQVVVLDFWGFW